MRYLVYGLGDVFEACKEYIDGEIVGYIDGKKNGQLLPTGERILSLEEGLHINYDKIIISSTDYVREIWERLVEANVNEDRILVITDFVTEEAFFDKYNTIIDKVRNHNQIVKNGFSKIYVVVEAGAQSGGPELLHQFVCAINENGIVAKMAYANSRGKELLDCVPTRYREYVGGSIVRLEDVEDIRENIIVIPETMGEIMQVFNEATIILWWLSVDNFWKKASGKIIENLYRKVYLHLYQSEYARCFLKKMHIDERCIRPLFDYINEAYISGCQNNGVTEGKEDIIVYNPKKGWKFTCGLIKKLNRYSFYPISNMTVSQVEELLKRAKVYIDFGNHPGKDRIPREAAMMGCCVITGNRGAANNEIDVPIPRCYKVEEKDDAAIINACSIIQRCIENYDVESAGFVDYRNRIFEEKREFVQQVMDLKKILF